MIAYYRISTAWVDEQIKVAELTWRMLEENRYFTLTAIDFWDWILNLKNQKIFDKNKERIMNFFENENQKIIIPKLIELDILDKCDNDNIVKFDLDKKTIDIGYHEEFFNF